MACKASILIPFRTKEASREDNLRFIAARLAHFHPGYEILVRGDGCKEGPFNKSRAINRLVLEAKTDILFIHDADVIIAAQTLDLCRHLLSTGLDYVRAFRYVYRLTPEYTRELLNSPPSTLLRLHPKIYSKASSNAPGGLFCLTRRMWDTIGGFDERFEGWGGEDSTFRKCLWLLSPRTRKLGGPLYHLWHNNDPERMSGSNPQYQQNKRLWLRYQACKSVSSLRPILREAKNYRESLAQKND